MEVTDRRKLTIQVIHLWDVWFPFLPLESIQSHSPGQYNPYKKPPQDVLRRPTPVHNMSCHNVDGLSRRGLMTDQSLNCTSIK